MGSRRNGSAIRLAGQAGGAGLAVFLVLAAYAGWLGVRDHAAFERRRMDRIRLLSAEQSHERTALSAVNRRIADLEADLAVQDEHRQLAERAVATLRAGDSWWRTAWARLFGDRAAMDTREEILAQLEQARAGAAARGAELRTAITRATWERDGFEIVLGRVERRLAAAERQRPTPAYYLGLAWRRCRWYVIAALAAWILATAWWQRRRSGFFR